MQPLLLVEDEDFAYEELIDALTRAGYTYDIVETVDDALAHLNASITHGTPYVAILTDWNLRAGKGTETIYWLRHNAVYRNTPIIASSSLQYKFDDVFLDRHINHNLHGIPKVGPNDIWDAPNVLTALSKSLAS